MSQYTPIEEPLCGVQAESDWSRNVSNPQPGPMSEGALSHRSTQDFEVLRGDLVSYLSNKFDLPVEVMRTKLGEWLFQRYVCSGSSEAASHGSGEAMAVERRSQPDAEAPAREAATTEPKSGQLPSERACDALVR